MERTESPRVSAALLILTVIIVAANLRTTVQGVGALIDQIQDDTGLTATTLGLLGALPLLMYALVSPLADGIGRRFGMNRTMTGALLVLLIATVVRSIDATLLPLWVGTVLTGVAIAVGNVMMPGVIKQWFPDRLHVMMPVYTAVLSGTGAIGSGLVVPISYITLGGDVAGWRFALLTSGIFIIPGIVMWLIAVRKSPPDGAVGLEPEPRATGIWRDPVAWLVAAYMGFQGAAFYMMVTWLSPLSISTGTDEVQAGFEVMIMQLCSIAGSLSVPFLLRGPLRRWVPGMLPFPTLIAIGALMIWPQFAGYWGALFGLSSGAQFAVSMWLMADRARNRTAATSLAGMAQSVGYAIAGTGPILFGALHTATGGWVVPLTIVLTCLTILVIAGVLLRNHRYVLDRQAVVRASDSA